MIQAKFCHYTGRLWVGTCRSVVNGFSDALGLNVGLVNGKATPAEHAPLTKNEGGPPASGSFNYASTVGMLLYLSGHSRPDITYSVNCAARYMFCA